MPDHPRRRAACDRCTVQKLRCANPGDSEKCARCLKAGAECVFAVSRRGLRPDQDVRKRKQAGQNGVFDEAAFEGEDVDWMGEIDPGQPNGDFEMGDGEFDIEHLLQDHYDAGRPATTMDNYHEDGMITTDASILDLLDGDMTMPLNPVGLGQKEVGFSSLSLPSNPDPRLVHSTPTGNPNANTLPEKRASARNRPDVSHTTGTTEPLPGSGSFCIKQLADLSVKLYKHAACIPPLSLWESDSFTIDNIPAKYREFAIDETFQLTQTLIDLYPQFISSILHQCPSTPIELDDGHPQSFRDATDSELCLNISSPERTPVRSSSAPPVIDNASILLLLSTHLRIIDIYTAIFRHIEACIKYSQHITPGHPALSISSPQLRIGSYAPKPDAAICMHVVLLMHLAGKLVEHAEGLVKEVQSLSTGADDTAVRFCNDVRHKANGMAEEIKRLNPKLMAPPGV